MHDPSDKSVGYEDRKYIYGCGTIIFLYDVERMRGSLTPLG